ncbi:MAG TPA: hypothetical protein VF796_02405 [Humisphaera sp.]
MRQTRLTAAKLLTAACLSALLGAGCVETDNHRHRDDARYEPRYEPRYDPPGPGGNWYDDRRYDDDRNYKRDTRSRDGRANANVPRGSKEVAIGKGFVGYRVPRDGRVYITESEFDRVIWSGRVYTGETIEVVPKRNRIFIDRNEVEKAPMKDDIRYRIYWDRDRY